MEQLRHTCLTLQINAKGYQFNMMRLNNLKMLWINLQVVDIENVTKKLRKG